MLRIVKYFVLVTAIVSGFGFRDNVDTNAKIKAVFLYNFTRYFEWPSEKRTGNFYIQVVGNNASLLKELNDLASKKQVGSQKIELINTPAFDGNTKAHMLFLLPEASKSLSDATAKLKGKGTLIISEKEGAAKSGSAINFVVIDNKQKFEYSKNSAIKAGLKTSEDFKSLAIAVD
ncbi:MAG: YfiR family protein [Bacteroidia bacterium]